MTDNPDAIIIGAGIAGLAAAQVLVDAGRRVRVIDKGRGVGGRMATRRIGKARLDHGAQFFTVRTEPFERLVRAAIEDGIVDVWCTGFTADDGYPRYYCPSGMTGLTKSMATHLSDQGVDIVLGTRAEAILQRDQWVIEFDGAASVRAPTFLSTAPVPQTLDLLAAGDVGLEAEVAAQLAAIEYKRAFALLVTLDRPSAIGEPGGIQQSEQELFTFIGDNQRKGVSEAPAVTFHVNGEVSGMRWDDSPEAIVADLLPEAAPWLGDASVTEVQVHKWKYAGPLVPFPERHLLVCTEPGPLVVAGDAFGGPKVEGAYLSGQSAAVALLA